MAQDNIVLSDIVQQTLLIPNLAVEKPWYKHVNWIDQLCATVNLIPCVGGAIAGEIKVITDAVANYQVSDFLRKFITFIYELGDFGDNERMQFLKELEESAQDTSGNVMLSIIDRLDNIHKQKILANLVRAKGEGKITIEDFFDWNLFCKGYHMLTLNNSLCIKQIITMIMVILNCYIPLEF